MGTIADDKTDALRYTDLTVDKDRMLSGTYCRGIIGTPDGGKDTLYKEFTTTYGKEMKWDETFTTVEPIETPDALYRRAALDEYKLYKTTGILNKGWSVFEEITPESPYSFTYSVTDPEKRTFTFKEEELR